MSVLEDLLLQSGAMTKAQIAIVREEQRRHGGSLGTNILALGYLTEDALQRILAQQWKQGARADYQQRPKNDAIALLDEKQANELQAVPHTLEGKQLFVLVDDPATVDKLGALEELSGYDLVPTAVSEVRLRFWLEECYGVKREPRYVEIMERILSRTAAKKDAKRASRDSLIGDPMAGLEEAWLAGAIVVERGTPAEHDIPLGEQDEDIPILEDELLIEVIEEEEEEEAAEDEGGETALEDAHQVLAAEEFGAALDEVTSMDGLPDIFFRFGVPFFKSVALFKVQSNMVMGWRGAGLGMVGDLIRGVVVPVQSDTFLARSIDEGTYVGQAGSNPVEERIAEQLGATGENHVVTGAVKVGKRPVLVVCGLAEDGAPDPAVVAQLGQLCEQASAAVLRIIMERKKAKQQDDGAAEDGDEPKKKKGAKKKPAKKKPAKKKPAKK